MKERNPGLRFVSDKPLWNADMPTHLHDNRRPEPSFVIHHPDLSLRFCNIQNPYNATGHGDELCIRSCEPEDEYLPNISKQNETGMQRVSWEFTKPI